MEENRLILLVCQPEIADGVGGAITMFVNFANMLTQRGYCVHAVYDSLSTGSPHNLDSHVKLTNMRSLNPHTSFKENINHYLTQNRPDLIIFFFPMLYAKAELNSEFDDIPRILMIHSRPDFYFTSKKKILKNLESLYRNTITQVLFPSFVSLLPEYIQKSDVVSIANPIYSSKTQADLTTLKKKIIYLSRIDRWKGQKFLIKSFKKIASKYPDWTLDIYGDSTPKEYVHVLDNLIKEEKLQDQIFLKGVTKTPMAAYLDYDFCVFPSYFEGFGLGLSDALSLGLPSIGLKGCTGVNELILDGYNGFLVDKDENQFAKAMETLITNQTLRIEMGKNAVTSMNAYKAEIINNQWIELIENILEKRPIVKTKAVSPKYEPFSIKKIKSIKKYTLKEKFKLTLQKILAKFQR